MSGIVIQFRSFLYLGPISSFFSFAGLDEEGDPKGKYSLLLFHAHGFCVTGLVLAVLPWVLCCVPDSDTTLLLQGNGGIAAPELQPTLNGYTCSDCSMLSERKEVLTAYSPSHVPSSRIYTRDRSQKHASSKLLSLVFHFCSVF